MVKKQRVRLITLEMMDKQWVKTRDTREIQEKAKEELYTSVTPLTF